MQSLINLAYDDSPATTAFKNQHYYYGPGRPYSVINNTYPWFMVWVVADSAERLP